MSEAYWLLSVMTAQLAVLFYILLFLAALRLRYKEGCQSRAYRIPGGKLGIWIVTGFGLFACMATFVIGFFPPVGVVIGNVLKFDTILIFGTLLFCLPPYLVAKAQRQ